MNKKQLTVIVLLVSLLSTTLSLFGYKYFFESNEYHSVESKQNIRLSNYLNEANTVVPEGLNFVYAANYVTPAVVHIKTYYAQPQSRHGGNSQNPQLDDFFRDFFGERYQQQPQPRQQNPSNRPQASGSGVIISADGYIVTNNHVINGADKIEVTLDDKRTFEAEIIGTDPTTDLAVLKVSEKNLPFVNFGNSDQVKVGEWVLAVGNPFNLTSTVTAGIVSAKARNIHILKDRDNLAIESFIQTDAAVNPGNSGGALVNLKGELVGINTAIATPTGTYAGYSFAVPATLVSKVVSDLMDFGTVQRALLGISIMDLSTELAKEKKIEQIRGVYIAGVREGSAADLAGIKEGDVITKINLIEVNSSSELQEQVARFRPGKKIDVTYVRKGKTNVVTAELQNTLGETGIIKKEEASIRSALGAKLVSVDQVLSKKLRIPGGVQINKLENGLLMDAGVKEGFIIIAIGKQRVNTPEEAVRVIELNKGAILIEGIYPDGTRDYFAIG
jgi:serine protease Do